MDALLVIILLLVAFFTMSWWMPREWYRRLLYTGGRPNALSRRLNAAQAWITSRGMTPALMVTLETRGRRTGKTSSVPLVVAELGGERFLVSMLGESADWVHNVRANGAAVLRYGKVEKVRLEEVAASYRAPILQAYLRRAPGGRPHFDIDMNAPLEEFERIAPRYPVFRVMA